MRCQNEALRPILRDRYTQADLDRVRAFLDARGTLRIHRKENGLYAAVAPGAPSAARYAPVWLRDTVMVANGLRETGREDAAAGTMRTVVAYFARHLGRFDAILDGRADPADPMVRPHVRFDGDTLDELPERWAHAQNDALGYALWMTVRLVREGAISPDPALLEVVSRFPAYFSAIQFWRDADSGHWEEARKVQSSSVGAVVAALSELAAWICGDADARAALGRARHRVTVDELQALVEPGRAALDGMLPDESPPDRGADAALLFLIHPLSIVSRPHADAILRGVRASLVGDHGVRRYAGDSYWCAGYKDLFSLERRTADFSDDLAARDRLLVPGTEAEWTIFDPVISVIHGRRYLADGRAEDLDAQVHHLNRALGQITADGFTVDGIARGGQCPEAYYVADPAKGARVPNDHVPLAWTQANLAAAIGYLDRSIGVAPSAVARTP